jgi:ferric-dicitrate binding protein FerR (iron transport regulator)
MRDFDDRPSQAVTGQHQEDAVSGTEGEDANTDADVAVNEVTERTWSRASDVPPLPAPSLGAGTKRVALFAAALAIVAGGVLLLGARADSRLTYELRGGSAVQGVIEARRGEATIALSDGSSILAENSSKFSVDVVGRNAALTRLHSGRLHVRVIHNDDTSYRFVAGPYEVRVVGTEFDLAWDPAAGLSLSMTKGEVKLLEPSGKQRTLRAGQQVQLPGGAFEPEAPAPAPAPVTDG